MVEDIRGWMARAEEAESGAMTEVTVMYLAGEFRFLPSPGVVDRCWQIVGALPSWRQDKTLSGQQLGGLTDEQRETAVAVERFFRVVNIPDDSGKQGDAGARQTALVVSEPFSPQGDARCLVILAGEKANGVWVASASNLKVSWPAPGEIYEHGRLSLPAVLEEENLTKLRGLAAKAEQLFGQTPTPAV